MNSSHSPTKFSRPANLTTYTIISGHSTRPSSTVTLGRPFSVSSSLQITNRLTLPEELAPFFIPSTSFFSLSSWFTSSCPYHLITVTTSHHLSLPQSFTPDLKLISFTNPFLHSHSYSFRPAFTDLEPLNYIGGHWRLFVLVSSFHFFGTCAID